MIVDSYAVLALLRGEPAAEPVAQLLEEGGARLTGAGVAETVDHLVRLVGVSEDDAALDVAQLGVEVIPVDEALAIAAGILRARHYHRRDRAVSIADCMVAAAAATQGVAVVSADPHLLDLCRDEGIARVVLPDSTGRRWHE